MADSFFSLAINGIESVAREKGYYVYLTDEDLMREESILRGFRSSRVNGVRISVSRARGAESNSHIHDLCAKNVPLEFFDRVCEGIEASKVLTDDFGSGLKRRST